MIALGPSVNFSRARCALTLLLWLSMYSIFFMHTVNALWGVDVTVQNQCSEPIYVSFDGVEDASRTLSPGSSSSFTLCSSFCTGFLGACKDYSWRFTSTVVTEGCDNNLTTESGTLASCGDNAAGSSTSVEIQCAGLRCSTPPLGNITTSPPPQPKPSNFPESKPSQNSKSIPSPADPLAPYPNAVGSSNQKAEASDCSTLTVSSPPMPSDPMTYYAAFLASEVYEERNAIALSNFVNGKLGMQVAEMFADDQTGVDALVTIGFQRIIVAFRGAEMEESNDLATIFRADFDDHGTHEGFSKALDAIYPQMIRFMREQAKPDTSLIVAGHSMGGALSTLFAERIQSEGSNPFNVEAVYTFGSPRTGNAQWASKYSDLNLDELTLRFVYYTDPIPVIPTSLSSYVHVGRPIFLSREGNSCTEYLDMDFEYGCKNDEMLVDFVGQEAVSLVCRVFVSSYGGPESACKKIIPPQYYSLCDEAADLYETGQLCCYVGDFTTNFLGLDSDGPLDFHKPKGYMERIYDDCITDDAIEQLRGCTNGQSDVSFSDTHDYRISEENVRAFFDYLDILDNISSTILIDGDNNDLLDDETAPSIMSDTLGDLSPPMFQTNDDVSVETSNQSLSTTHQTIRLTQLLWLIGLVICQTVFF